MFISLTLTGGVIERHGGVATRFLSIVMQTNNLGFRQTFFFKHQNYKSFFLIIRLAPEVNAFGECLVAVLL